MPTTKQRAAFLAALTATDQLAPAERQRLADNARRADNNRAKGERYVAYMEARAACHEAEATDTRMTLARATDMPDRNERAARHDAASYAMLSAYARFMMLPLVGLDDAKARRVMIRKGRGVIGGSNSREAYMAATVEWLAHIEADAARFGRR